MKRLSIISLAVVFLLAIPLIAMQFTNEVNWTFIDFVIMGVLLFATGLMINLVGTRVTKKIHRFALIVLVLGIFLVIWAELAVGILGTLFAGS
ncbi:hypothetical protein [Pararhodonellum marinum]|uniref:hypothetical protein n=1 Tax=Pararhodonellum marinum TaxID=2755358 RepID=UPI00188F7387|nr:hypothetical protein [Pararhodonellum marinum]